MSDEETVEASAGDEKPATSGEHPPFAHHLVTEVRKLVAPVLAALVAGAMAGGGVSLYQAGETRTEVRKEIDQEVKAVKKEVQAEVKAGKKEAVKKAEDRAGELDHARGVVRKELLKRAATRDLNMTDKAEILKACESLAPELDTVKFRSLIKNEYDQAKIRQAIDRRAR